MSPAISDQALADRARRLIEEGVGRADHAVIDEVVAPDCIEHQRGHVQGSASAHNVATTIHRWFSDLRITVQDVAVEGDIVWLRSRVEGTNTGSIMGFAPTGKPVSIDLFDVARLADGRIVEHWGLADQLGILIQLGHVPCAAQGPSPTGASAAADATVR